MFLLFALVACTPDPTPPAPVVDDPPVLLVGPALLRRISLDLRGVLPSVSELDAVEADPTRVWEFRDQYLNDPLLEDRLIEVFNLDYHTIIREFEWSHGDLFPADEIGRNTTLARQVGEQPLRYMARLAVEDRPWTEVLMGDTTMATPFLASFNPVDYRDEDTGWEEVAYNDGRPAAGVLAMTSMWWRYESNNNNNNRSRAAAITRILLCRDLFTRSVSFSATGGTLSTEEIEDAVHNEPGCLACHSTLDPLAATLFGFFTASAEIVTYRAERESIGPERLDVEPAYFGTPVEGLAQVGEMIAQDPRFPRCTTEQMARAFWGRDLTDADASTVEDLEHTFLTSGMKMKALLAAITESEDYQLGAVDLEIPEADLPDVSAARMMPPDILADAVEDATGFRWTQHDIDMMSDDETGFRQVAGGVDGLSQLRTQRVPGVMWTLVVKRLAEAAAGHAVEHAGDVLFTHATLETRPGDAEFAIEVEELAWRLTATRLSASDELLLEALWTDAEALSDPAAAWQAVISVMLREPAFLFY